MSKPRLFMNSLNSALSQTFLIAVSYCWRLLRQALGRRKAAPHTLVPLVTRRLLGGRRIREVRRALG